MNEELEEEVVRGVGERVLRRWNEVGLLSGMGEFQIGVIIMTEFGECVVVCRMMQPCGTETVRGMRRIWCGGSWRT